MKKFLIVPMAMLAVLMFAGLSFSADMTSSGQNFFPNRQDQNYVPINPNVADQGHYGLAPSWSKDHGSVDRTNSGQNFFPNRQDQNYVSNNPDVAGQGHYGLAPSWSKDHGGVDRTNSRQNFFPNRQDQNLL